MKRTRIALIILLWIGAICCDDDDYYGPYWSHTELVPVFTAKQDSVSTSFTGRVWPETHFVFGADDGFTFTKPNARLTINANSVWAYDPVVVSLYDGNFEDVGSDDTLIRRWEVENPPLGGEIGFVDSQWLNGRVPLWVVIDFIDFSGVCILEVLGHD